MAAERWSIPQSSILDLRDLRARVAQRQSDTRGEGFVRVQISSRAPKDCGLRADEMPQFRSPKSAITWLHSSAEQERHATNVEGAGSNPAGVANISCFVGLAGHDSGLVNRQRWFESSTKLLNYASLV